ncbi:hypothetical protein DOTSEDRAFT_75612 [Dothistroma septosporum NZE10]|uniref:Uncharacterized protein n=1 Tax=Dothistroma septosporum (strain NZE10 / CBS 128990) TaxID=675120 RepID=M2WJ13_DOTSN|nr:hypothetical protein DOTSEDRAFT_75612 [Dothistroma septosporum NZE10]
MTDLSMSDFEARIMAKANKGRNKPDTDLLGLTSPLNSIADHSWPGYDGTRPRFPNALSDWSATPLMLRERMMIAFMAQITDKPEWTRKIFDGEIVGKWRREAIEQSRDEEPEKAFGQKMFAYCIDELRHYAEQQEERGFFPAIGADATVFKSDTVISDELKADLVAAAAPLEDVPESAKDWHPDSDERVLDLVHPSLFPLLYGRSRILKIEDGIVPLENPAAWTGKGEIMPVPAPDDLKLESTPGLSNWGRNSSDTHFYSAKFQWLPCEVAFKGDDSVKITSYINNLQPEKHKALYEVLERIIAKTIPMWDPTLASAERSLLAPRIDLDDIPWIEPEGEREPDSDEDEDEGYELDEEWRDQNRTLIVPEPEKYATRRDYTQPDHLKTRPINLRHDFADRGLQVIVKLANIHLTPEKPTHDGGAWHIEGQLNEHICASALYYYSSDNITDSHLAFREATSAEHLMDKPYEQSDYRHFERLYGIEQHGPAVQELGQVLTCEGRLLTFPNVLQHRVSPFSLADSTRPGHRKIVALFLVDPYTRIPSTANVPPQQKNWWRKMVLALDRVGDLPPELAENVMESAGDFPIELEEAKKLRLELMAERKLFVKDHETKLRHENFSFCEH